MFLPSPEAPFATAADHAACRAAIRQGSRTFHAASLLLPSSLRQPAYGLYAFCRLSDDAIDLSGGSLAALKRLRDRLTRACEGRPHPVAADRAMADLLARYAIPRTIPEALLEGLSWDAEGRRYDTLDELLAYAMRVAGTVGVMMTLLMGVRTPDALARACDLGCAMQLTNIARDVGEDARAGRIYLPLEWLDEAGLDPARLLTSPVADDALKSVVARLLAEADRLYARACGGIALLPLSCRPAILSAALLYAEIGRALEAMSLDSVRNRARVPGWRKLQLAGRALATAPLLAADVSSPALPAAAFLIEAVARMPVARTRHSAENTPQVAIGRRFIRVLEIFERVERAGQFGE